MKLIVSCGLAEIGDREKEETLLFDKDELGH